MRADEEKKIATRQKLQVWLATKSNLDASRVMHQALNLLASKWLLLLLLALTQRPKRNSALQRQQRDTSPKILAQSLRQLESNGLAHCEVFTQVPPQVEYSLISFGKSVAPLLDKLTRWAITWASQRSALTPAIA